jgi:hypothetical protein
MKDLGSYRVPREAELGREVLIESRRSANRTALFAAGGILLLCVCLCVGVAGLASPWGLNLLGDSFLAFGGAEPTAIPRSSARGTPTAVPYGRAARSDNGLRVTVTAYQRPLPTEDIEIPEGQELVLVSVRVDNSRTTGAPLKFDPEDFALVTDEGERYPVTIGGITTGENLIPGEVGPGENTRGDLIFYIYSDVPEPSVQLAWTSADGKTRLFQLAR